MVGFEVDQVRRTDQGAGRKVGGGSTLAGAQQGMRNGMTAENHPVSFPARESLS